MLVYTNVNKFAKGFPEKQKRTKLEKKKPVGSHKNDKTQREMESGDGRKSQPFNSASLNQQWNLLKKTQTDTFFAKMFESGIHSI